LPAGSYNGTITDANGCTLSSPSGFNITQPASALTLNGFPTVADVTCFGTCDGSVTGLVPAGGTTPYTYEWSNGETTQDITGLCAGAYNGTITDANGCTLSSPNGFNVDSPDSLVVSGVITNASAAGGDGAVNVTIVGGTAPYVLDWSNGEITEDISGLDSGSYTLVITDAAGCFGATTFIVSGPVGINALAKEGAVSIYPNPTNDNLNIKISLPEVAGVQVKVYDMKGSLVQEVTGQALQNHLLSLDVSTWAEGVYNVTITSANQTITKRVSVNR
jgi:hypothetical protein